METIVLTAVATLTLLLFILLMVSSRGREGAILHFKLTVLFLFGWEVSIILTLNDPNPERVLYWSRLSFLFPALFSMTLHPFTFLLAPREWRRSVFKPYHYTISLFLYGMGFVFALLSLTPLILTSVTNLTSTLGPLAPLYSAFIITSFAYIGYLLARASLRARGHLKSQFQFILYGIAISAVFATLTNLILPLLHLGEFRALGPISVTVFIAMTTYAILAHHLFDIKLIIKRTLVYSLLLATVVGVYTFLTFMLTTTIGSGGLPGPREFLSNLIAVLVVGLGLNPLRTWLEESTEHLFFKKQYEQQAVLKELSQNLNGVIGLDEALEVVMRSITKTFHLKHAVTYVFQQSEHGKQAIKRIKQIGYTATTRLILEDRDFTVEYFATHPRLIQVSDFKTQVAEEQTAIEKRHIPAGEERAAFVRSHAIKAAVLKKLESLDVEVVIPLHLKEQPLGLLLISGKLSDESFSSEDLTLLELIGDQAISSIQKARLFEGDQMKSEFVSIASHELLTPISAIEGYLSMILDERIGGKDLDKQTQDYLNRCFSSAKRLSMLVKDLLSVSRIESGKMKIAPQQLDLSKSIKDTLDQLKFVAEEKKVKLIFEEPSSPLPPVWADSDRTTQVLVNLISNGIKYNRPEGGDVTVSLAYTKRDGLVTVSITDNGLGMSRQQTAHLFEKFYRVDRPETVGIIGTGLGLYITKSIIERMGGSISLKSTLGKGSTFSFTLPIFQVERSSVMQ